MWNSLQPGHLRHLQTSLDRQGWHADSTCTAFSHLSFNILFDSINHFHVHMYISCWGPEEQSPSLEINFDSTNLVCRLLLEKKKKKIHSNKQMKTTKTITHHSS